MNKKEKTAGFTLTLLQENTDAIKIEIHREMAKNREKCKQLFSNIAHFWNNTAVFYSGYLIENKAIYITECKDARFFSTDALRASFSLSEDITPSISMAISRLGGGVLVRAVVF